MLLKLLHSLCCPPPPAPNCRAQFPNPHRVSPFLSLSLSISVYLAHLIFHSGWKLELHRQRCMWSFSLSAILGAKKIFSALLFAHFRFPLQLHVLRRATDPPPAHRYVLYMQQISRYAQNASCAALHCRCQLDEAGPCMGIIN